MAKEDLGKLSPSQLKKLGKVISEAKDLTNQQAEIIEKVLAGEEDIGKLRISYLEQYFDTYSTKLDTIARKHSALNDTFLVLDNKLNENYKALSSDLAKLEAKLKNLAKTTGGTQTTEETTSTKNADNTSKDSPNSSSSVQDILQALDGGVKLNQSQFKDLLTKTQTALRNIKLDKTQYQTLLDKLSGTLVQVAPIEPSTTQQSVAEADNTHGTPSIELSEAVLGVREAIEAGLDVQRSTMDAVFDTRDNLSSVAQFTQATAQVVDVTNEKADAVVLAGQEVTNAISQATVGMLSGQELAKASLQVQEGTKTAVLDMLDTVKAGIKVDQAQSSDDLLNVYHLFQEILDRSLAVAQPATTGKSDSAATEAATQINTRYDNLTAEPSVEASTKTAELILEIRNVLQNGVKLEASQLNALITNIKSRFSDVTINTDQYQTLLTVIASTAKEQIAKDLASAEAPPDENVTSVIGNMTAGLKEAIKDTYTFATELYDRSSHFIVEYSYPDMLNASANTGAEEAAAASETNAVSATPTAAGGQPPQVPPMPTESPRPVKVANTVSEKEIAALKETEDTAADFLRFLDGIAKDGIKAYTQEVQIKDAQTKRNVELAKTWAKTEDEIKSSMLKLAIAKLQTQEELENRSIEIRLSRLQSATDAELKAQQLLNQIDLQLRPDITDDADQETGDARARKTNADLNIKAYQELEKQLAEYRAKLDRDIMLETGKELTAAEAAANEKAARQYIADRKDAIIKETRERLLAEEKLAQLRKTNPKVAQEYEKHLAEYKEKLDRDAIIANNGILTEEAEKANARLTQEYAKNNRDIIIQEMVLKQKLAAEVANATKNDPSVAQEYEKRLADYKAQLDLESRRANNGILTEEAAKANEQLAQADFANRREALLAEIAAEQQFKAELAEAAKNNSKAVQEFERQMAEEQYMRDRESRLANGGILTQAAAEANAAAVRAEFEARREELLAEIATKQLAEEDLANTRKLANARENEMTKYRARLELESRKKNNGILSADEAKRIKDLVEERYDLEGKEMEKLAKRQLEDDKKDAKRESRKAIDDVANTALSKDNNLLDRFTVLSRATEDKVTNLGDGDEGDEKVAKAIAGLDTAMTLLSDLAKRLDGAIDKVGSFQGVIDTRLQGSSNKQHRGSYWGQLTRDMMSVGAVTPFFKQEDFANNIKTLVEQGISFDLKQRAFLMTIQEKIANTFNVADGTLLRLIRIQQEDSTAGRLGMESALNSFLNNMYENTEYLKGVAESVRSSLEEMEALMTGAAATEVEYQVQKWMGSLYSVGMSQNAVNAIATAIGQVASGQIEALTNGGAGNLLVMAANDAGIPIADILTDGLDAKETNKLLQATVNYLAEIAEASKGNNVVQQQLANVFGVKASDLRAATNLAEPGSTSDIFGQNMTYSNMIRQLNNMAKTMGDRVSWGEKLTNIWQNGEYTLASSLANSPAAYLTYKLAGLLDDAVGGIALPFINVMGFGVDLNTTVADLMRVAAMTGGILSNLGPMVSGLASSFSGQAMLSKMGIGKGSGLEVVHRGKGDGASAADSGGGSSSTSGSGYVGNSDGNSVKEATIQEAEDSKKKQMIEAKEEEPANQVDVLNGTVLKIYELLDNVANGSQTLRVRVDNYGLTGLANNKSSGGLSNNLGSTSSGAGVAGLGGGGTSGGSSGGGSGVGGSSSNGSYSSGSGSFGGVGASSSSGVTDSGGNGFGSSGPGSISLGGWTTI